MATDTPDEPISDLPYHPGEFAAEETAARGLTPAELAEAMKLPVDEIIKFLECQTAVTPVLAKKLSEVFEVSADSWMSLQRGYERSLEQNRRRATA